MYDKHLTKPDVRQESSEIRFRRRLCPGPRLESLQRSPDHLVNSEAPYNIKCYGFTALHALV